MWEQLGSCASEQRCSADPAGGSGAGDSARACGIAPSGAPHNPTSSNSVCQCSLWAHRRALLLQGESPWTALYLRAKQKEFSHLCTHPAQEQSIGSVSVSQELGWMPRRRDAEVYRAYIFYILQIFTLF